MKKFDKIINKFKLLCRFLAQIAFMTIVLLKVSPF